MDFFDRQEVAKRKTFRLIILFSAAIVLTVIAVSYVILLFYGFNFSPKEGELSLWQPKLFFWVSVGTILVVAVGSIIKMSELAEGGPAVAIMLGGRLIAPNTTDPNERKLINVVDEMSIASGVPSPALYVLPDLGINAFAAGYTTSDAVIGVTRGCLKLLTRDELQGVIGHEFSHILNGDIRLNIRLISLIFGITSISIIGRTVLRVRSRSALPIVGFALMIVGSIGAFFGRLIQSAISRQREFLADAASVQFTRNPSGLAGALKKIGGLTFGSVIASPQAEATSHLFFADALTRGFFDLFATHPPLVERIKLLDPSWDGKFPVVRLPEDDAKLIAAAFLKGDLGLKGEFRSLDQDKIKHDISPNELVVAVGSLRPIALQVSQDWHKSLSPAIKEIVKEPTSALAMFFGFLIDENPDIRQVQLQGLEQTMGKEIAQLLLKLLPEIQSIPYEHRLPLLDLAIPAMRNMSHSQFDSFMNATNLIIEADMHIDLFEYMLQKIIKRHLLPCFQTVKTPVQYYSIRPLASDAAVILSALAYIGTNDISNASRAFQLAWPKLQTSTYIPSILSKDQCSLSQVDSALSKFEQAIPIIKKNLITACAWVVAADGVIKPREFHLLRAIADTLDCPIPPVIEAPQIV